MTSDNPSTRIVFFQVKKSTAKLQVLCDITALHFKKKEKILIFTEDETAQNFVDDLLWKTPSMGFLPHVIADAQTLDFIAITKTKHNVNDAKIAINLCPTPLIIPFRLIYDFEDLSSPIKNKLSSLRFDAYKSAQFLIESRQVQHT